MQLEYACRRLHSNFNSPQGFNIADFRSAWLTAAYPKSRGNLLHSNFNLAQGFGIVYMAIKQSPSTKILPLTGRRELGAKMDLLKLRLFLISSIVIYEQTEFISIYTNINCLHGIIVLL